MSATTSGGFYFAKPGLDDAACCMHMCYALHAAVARRAEGEQGRSRDDQGWGSWWQRCRWQLRMWRTLIAARQPIVLSGPICGAAYFLRVSRGSRGSRVRQRPIFYTSAASADVF